MNKTGIKKNRRPLRLRFILLIPNEKLLVQTTVVKCGVQQKEILTVLFLVKYVVHPLDVLLNSLFHLSVALFLGAVVSCKLHLGIDDYDSSFCDWDSV